MFFIFIILFTNNIFANQNSSYLDISNKKELVLTDKESQYLKNKKEIILCVRDDFMPYEDLINNEYKGILSSYFILFEKMIHIPIKVKNIKSNHNRCDIISSIEFLNKNQNLILTKPYMVSPLVVVTKSTELFISDFNNLNHTKFGLAKNFNYIQELKNIYPNVNEQLVNSVRIGFHKVNKGELFGQIGTLADAAYFFQTDFKGELKITGKTDSVALKFQMGISKKDKVLHTIMQKAIDNLEPSVHYNILSIWTNIRYDKGLDYKFLVEIVVVFLIIVVLISIFSFVLQQKNKKLQKIKNEIIYLNQTLEQRVKEEVEQNKKHQLMLMQQSRLAKMGELVTMIAHQWRQPLGSINSILINMQLNFINKKFDFSKKEDIIKYNQYLDKQFIKLNNYSKYLSDTINDFIYFYQPSKSKKLIPVTSAIDKALGMVESDFKFQGININKEYNHTMQLEIYENELIQVILNILKNSEENFIQKDIENPTISILTKTIDNHFVIVLCDNGKGIENNILNKIFDPYFSTKNIKNNTGLGLYMSRMIIQEHFNGEIDLVNSNNGVCFNIRLELYDKQGT